jgi:guanylate kinase
VILEIEVQGARQIRQRFPAAVLIFISPPSMQALKERLVGRGTETAAEVSVRLETARKELDSRALFDYEVVNDNLDEAIRNLSHIVYAERCRIPRASI